MKKTQPNSFLALGFLLFILHFSHPSSTQAQEAEDEKEFDYTKGSNMGPEKWGEIKKEWWMCNNGKMQSPIDMASEKLQIVVRSRKLYRNYKPQNATINNRGHDIMLQWEGDAGIIRINGIDYALKQVHWHSPSEHTINGERYDLELHVVHLSDDNKIAAIAILYTIGEPDQFLSKLAANITALIDQKGKHVQCGIIDPIDIQMIIKCYYRYSGSLTTPPCSKGVVWTVINKIRTVSNDQVKLLRDAVLDYAENNARSMQQDNDRDIYFYSPALRK